MEVMIEGMRDGRVDGLNSAYKYQSSKTATRALLSCPCARETGRNQITPIITKILCLLSPSHNFNWWNGCIRGMGCWEEW